MASKEVYALRDRLIDVGGPNGLGSLAVAARTALRTIPLLERLAWDKPYRKRMRASLGRARLSNSEIVLGTLRGAATAWVAARFPAFGASAHFQELKHAARMAGGAEDAGDSIGSYAPAATHNAMMSALYVYPGSDYKVFSQSKLRDSAAMSAAQTTLIAALAFAKAYGSDQPEAGLGQWEDLAWSAAWHDAAEIANGQAVLLQPLWRKPAPAALCEDRQQLAERLLARPGEQWRVWTEWYAAQLDGPASLGEAHEIARVSLDQETWTAGPAAANASILAHDG
jgi:hypothetical protein